MAAKTTLTQDPELTLTQDDRLYHELNLLRLEGFYFCFDPKEAGRRTKAAQENPRENRTFAYTEIIKLGDGSQQEKPLVIKIEDEWGYPSPLTYKICSAIQWKLMSYGWPIPEAVYLSKREIARLIGRKSYGNRDYLPFRTAIKQLRHTNIVCWFYDKVTDTLNEVDFQILDKAVFAHKTDGDAGNISGCYVELNSEIVESLNNRHWLCINHERLRHLEPIGMALYKHFYYTFSRVFSSRLENDSIKGFKYKQNFTCKRDYGSVCQEWLGGLKEYQYKSDIEHNQLGKHLKTLKAKPIELIRKYEIEKNSRGTGFNIIVYPGKGFFEDYARYYAKDFQLEIPFLHATEHNNHKAPFLLVMHFYELLYPNQEIENSLISESELNFARDLLSENENTFEKLKDLISYSIAESKRINFPIKFFGGIRKFIPEWRAGFEKRAQKSFQEAEENRVRKAEKIAEQYHEFLQLEIERIKNTISPSEIQEMQREAAEHANKKLEAQGIDITGLIGPNLLASETRRHLHYLIEERYNIPSLDEWKLENKL